MQIPLAQSGPFEQVVFGSAPVGMQNPPVHLPLWQSLGWAQCEPAGEPELAPPDPPLDVEPPAPVEPPVPIEPLAPVEPLAPAEPPAADPPLP